MSENTKICRICLTATSSYSQLDDIKHQMLKIVTPVTGSVIDLKSIICDSCTHSLQQSFDFKSKILSNEEYLKTFLCSDGAKLVLRDVIPKQELTENINKWEDMCPCRLCFGYFESNFFTDLNRIEDDFFLKDMLEKSLPEINLDITRKPLLCNNCYNSLQEQYNLTSNILDTNDKIENYISCIKDNDDKGEIDLRKVLQFTTAIKTQFESSSDVIKVKEEVKCEVWDDIEQNEIHIKVEDCLSFEEDESATKETIIDEKSFKETSDGLYECLLCRHETNRRDSIIIHLEKHQQTALYKCDTCDFTSKWRSSLNQHLWLHRDTKMFQCNVCSYKTRYKKHLRRHNKRHGISEELPKYQCEYCKFQTKSDAYFKVHNKSKHDKVVTIETTSTYACDICDFVTDKKCSLRKHRRSKHKRFMCERCGLKASNEWHLKEHMLKHKDEEEVTMLRCAKCDFQTKYRNSLKGHIARHGPQKKKAL